MLRDWTFDFGTNHIFIIYENEKKEISFDGQQVIKEKFLILQK